MSCINKVYERQAQKQNNPQPLSCAVVTRNTDVYKNQQIQQLTELLLVEIWWLGQDKHIKAYIFIKQIENYLNK